MPNFSGIWTVTQQMQAKGVCTWTAPPGPPTIGTATAGLFTCASVTFIAPTYTGYPAGITGYKAVSTPGCITTTGASSPLVVTGLTANTTYTFAVSALGASGYGTPSANSNSITAKISGQQAYTASGTYTWVAPANVFSVSLVAVGGGGGGTTTGVGAGAGAGLVYTNNVTVIPGNSYTVVVGARSIGGVKGGDSSFGAVMGAYGGGSTGVAPTNGGGAMNGGTGFGGTIGQGGSGVGPLGSWPSSGGAGGYGGPGGAGGSNAQPGQAGSNGGGGGGGSGANSFSTGAAGGGVGILGQGANGTGGGIYGGPGGAGSGGVGAYYGGGGCASYNGGPGNGAVRIIWPGDLRSFPTTNTGDV